MKTALVFKSGGFRGIASAKNYKKVEGLYKPDLLAGSSTGAILGLGIALGFKADKIIDLYLNEAKKIFLPSQIYKISSLNGFLLPKYEAKQLEKVLRNVFGEVKLGELPIKFMCNAYNLTKDEPIYFKSWKPEFADIPAWLAVKASCSAPTYFASTIYTNGDRLVDGGVDNGSLTLSSYIELKKESITENIKIVEFGVGMYKRKFDIIPEGMKNWLPNIINLFMDSNNSSQTYILNKIKNDGDVYILYDDVLSWDVQMDDVSDRAIKELLK